MANAGRPHFFCGSAAKANRLLGELPSSYRSASSGSIDFETLFRDAMLSGKIGGKSVKAKVLLYLTSYSLE